MLALISLWLLYLLISFIGIVILKDLIALSKYNRLYKGQKIKIYYKPWIGYLSLLLPGENKEDAYHKVDELNNKQFKNEDLICYTDALNMDIGVMLLNPELIKEFFIKEAAYSQRLEMIPLSLDLDFFFKGEKAMLLRGIFNNFFKIENMKKVTPVLRDKIEFWVQHLKNKYFNNCKGEFLEIDMRKIFEKMMGEIVNDLLFGDKDTPKVEGKSLTEAVEEFSEIIHTGVMNNPLYLLTFGLVHKLKLLKATREAEDLCLKMAKACEDSICKRRAETNLEDLGATVRDLMIKHNLVTEEKEKQLSMRDMVGNSISLIEAGNAPTKNTLEMLLYQLSRRPEKFEKIYEESKKILVEEEDKYDHDCYFKSDYITAIINEGMRLNCIDPFSFTRKVTKNMKLGKYRIYKGTKLVFSYHGNHRSEKYFEKSDQFDENRFLDRKNKTVRNAYLPFSSGPRSCIGRNFAEIVMRIFLCVFSENFEMKKQAVERKTVVRSLKAIDECLVEIRPREFRKSSV